MFDYVTLCWTQGQMQRLDVPCRRKMRRRQGRLRKTNGTTGEYRRPSGGTSCTMLCIAMYHIECPWSIWNHMVNHDTEFSISFCMGLVTKERLRADSKNSVWVPWCEPWVPEEFMIRYASLYRFLECTFPSQKSCTLCLPCRKSDFTALWSTFPVLAIKLCMVHTEGEPQQCHWIVVDEESVQA